MSDTAARSALERMNLREIAIAVHMNTLSADLQHMAGTDPDAAQKKFMEQRRNELCEAYGLNGRVQDKPFAFANGVAIIPVSGSLINRFGQSYGFVTGYNFIRRQMALAMADDDVLGIVGDFNSYGGEAAGCFELADEIFAMRGKKPMIAVVDSNCYSAAYAVASSFDKIICTPSGGTGSIGVVAMHVSIEKLLKEVGYDITFIHFGEHKVDGNPYENLSPSVKKDIQKGVDASGDKFVALVARNRNIGAEVVKATEARTYRAEDAKALGLIDTIAAPTQAMQVFFDELSGSLSTQATKGDDMSTAAENKPGAPDQATTDAANAKAVSEAASAARTAERARVSGIMNCEEAKGKQALANHIAMDTEMSLADAQKMLAKAAPETAEAQAPSGNAFADAMDKGQHPQVGADGNPGNGAQSVNKADAIFNDFKAAGGIAK